MFRYNGKALALNIIIDFFLRFKNIRKYYKKGIYCAKIKTGVMRNEIL